MHPLALLALLGGGLYVAPKVLGKKKPAAKSSSKRRPLVDPLKQFALCGASWDAGFAGIPYQASNGLWYCRFMTGNGSVWAKTEGKVFGASSKDDAESAGWPWLFSEIARSGIGSGIPDSPSSPWLRVYGGGRMPAEVDTSFCTNIATNRIWVNPKCHLIVEGAGFEPGSLDQFGISAVEAPSLAETMAIPGNSVYGYVDYLLKHGSQSAIAIATTILHELGCSETHPGSHLENPVATWWRDDFARRISSYVEDAGGIPFAP